MAGKAKTRKSISKRFKITRTGKVLRRLSGMDHLRTRKSKRTKANQKKWVLVPGPLAKKIKSSAKY
jgi:large subunit ribosomal protein L35